jgi:hypothetical protein
MTATEISTLPDEPFAAPSTDGDTTLVKSTHPATCAVCRQVVTASIVLPDDRAVCQFCACIALRTMIDDAAGGKGPVRP